MTETAAYAWTLPDLVLLVGLGLSMVVGAWRGLVTEMLSLAGWGVSYFLAQWFGAEMGSLLPIGQPGQRLNVLAGMIVVFVLAWLGWALISWAITQVVRASALSAPDRVLGAGFGLMRGVVVALVVVTLVGMTPVAKWPSWQASRGVAWMQVMLKGLRPVLPEQVIKFLPEQPSDF
ncbi:MAG TPA: CvpA family protein [Aquabacterium sp.]|uniref:CvpA family protein n=1 Tax=Aquabacterium sp. TaxID=1872578 RepID=UPI002E32D3E0|nr:CvpA family protein [Aquabacterium sp.]HEX5355441.1 CvpA family protein [Aquabacterium sp.]